MLYVLASAAQLAQEHEFPVDVLYFELCKRKNVFYLGEMWQKQGVSATEIHNLLRKDFSFQELKAAIPKECMLIDFFYVRIFYMDEEFNEDAVDSRKNSTCTAFTLTSVGDVKLHMVSDGIKLAEKIELNETPYFNWIANRLLVDTNGVSRLWVCTDGDMNRLNIASFPYSDGYVTDYFAVRNIASVYDIVYPHPQKEMSTALVVSSPDFGKDSTENYKWPSLDMSGLEGKFISEILANEHGITNEHLTSSEATAENISDRLAHQSYSAVHISTHGYFESGNVYIVTAGANENDIGTTISDSEFAKFSLENTSLVTFALCFGAWQSLSLQDSLSGFIKSSLLAGVNAVIAPIAPIPDLCSTIMMSEFYRRYLEFNETENAEVTLQNVIFTVRKMSKNELLRKYKIDYSEEYPFAEVKNWGSWVCFSAEGKR